MAKEKRFYTKYSPEFKISVILDMRENHLSYRATARKYWGAQSRSEEDRYKETVRRWERTYLEEGEAGFYIEKRGRAPKMSNSKKGRPKKALDPTVERDLIDEVQRLKEENEYLRMEIEYIKKLDALVRRDEQRFGKKPKS